MTTDQETQCANNEGCDYIITHRLWRGSAVDTRHTVAMHGYSLGGSQAMQQGIIALMHLISTHNQFATYLRHPSCC